MSAGCEEHPVDKHSHPNIGVGVVYVRTAEDESGLPLCVYALRVLLGFVCPFGWRLERVVAALDMARGGSVPPALLASHSAFLLTGDIVEDAERVVRRVNGIGPLHSCRPPPGWSLLGAASGCTAHSACVPAGIRRARLHQGCLQSSCTSPMLLPRSLTVGSVGSF